MQGDFSRRSFLRGSALTTAGASMLNTTPGYIAGIAAEEAFSPLVGPDAVSITLQVNGKTKTLRAEPRMTLAEALRGPLGLTGTKIACNRGACSACTVWLDGTPVCACMMLAIDVGDTPCHDHRRPRPRRHAASGAAGLHRSRRAAMRLLHAGHDHELCGAARAQRGAQRRRCSHGDQRPHMPLRHISARHRRYAGRRQSAARPDMAKQQDLRTETFPAGIASVGLGTVERQIPVDEPPPLPPNSELAVIGKSFPRLNGRAKVTGAIALHRRHRAARHAARPHVCARRCRTRWFAPSI